MVVPTEFRQPINFEAIDPSKIVSLASNPEKFREHINYIIKNDCDLFQIGIDWSFLGFLEDYWALSKLIPAHYIVVDVGCSSGFQHVIFKDYKKYIGIDSHDTQQKAFSDNAEFIIGDFEDVYTRLAEYPKDKLFGIANMSILYRKDNGRVLSLFKETFNQMFIR